MAKAALQSASDDNVELRPLARAKYRTLHAVRIMCNCGPNNTKRKTWAERTLCRTPHTKGYVAYVNRCLQCGHKWPTIKQALWT